MLSPKVSVLTPIFNEEDHVGKTLDSILGQTFSDFELILVDDGSTDNTLSILKDYHLQDSRIVLIENKQNRGLVYSLNRGLTMTRGSYIARVDANDICHPERFSKQVSYMEQHPETGVLGTNMIYIDVAGHLLQGGRPKDKYPLSPEIIRWMLLFRSAIYHTTVMMRKDILDQTGYKYDISFLHAEDRDLWTKLGRRTTLASLPEPLVFCRLLPTGISSDFKKEQCAMDASITRRELTTLLGDNLSGTELETLINVFSRHNQEAYHDFVGAADLLFDVFSRFCEQPLSLQDRRQIEQDVIHRLLLIAEEASKFSKKKAFILLGRLRYGKFTKNFSFDLLKQLVKVIFLSLGIYKFFRIRH